MRFLVAGVSLLLATGACDRSSPASDPAAANAPPASALPASTSVSAASAAAPTAAPDTVIAQHILVIYKGAKRAPKTVTRSKAEARARALEALGKVHAGLPFEDAVKQYSEDAASLDRLGSVGKFRREAMDPTFSAAAFALALGQVSEVVESPFGFHVIKRTQ